MKVTHHTQASQEVSLFPADDHKNAKNRQYSKIHCNKRKKAGKDRESIQSSSTLDPGYQWESDNFTIRHHKREPDKHDPQKKDRLGTVSKKYWRAKTCLNIPTINSDVNQDT